MFSKYYNCGWVYLHPKASFSFEIGGRVSLTFAFVVKSGYTLGDAGRKDNNLPLPFSFSKFLPSLPHNYNSWKLSISENSFPRNTQFLSLESRPWSFHLLPPVKWRHHLPSVSPLHSILNTFGYIFLMLILGNKTNTSILCLICPQFTLKSQLGFKVQDLYQMPLLRISVCCFRPIKINYYFYLFASMTLYWEALIERGMMYENLQKADTGKNGCLPSSFLCHYVRH